MAVLRIRGTTGIFPHQDRCIKLLQQGYIPFDDSEFYHEGARYAEGAGQRIKTVDPITNGSVEMIRGSDNRSPLLLYVLKITDVSVQGNRRQLNTGYRA